MALDGAVRSQVRLTPPKDLDDLYTQLAAYLERIQNGGINLFGLRLQLRATAPTDAPAANQPNFVLVENPGGFGPQPYVYVLGTGWVPVTQTVVPGPHDLASTGGLGSQHTVAGLTAGQVLVATGATTAVFALLAFAALSGALAFGQLPTNVAGGTWSVGGPLSLTGGVVTVAGLTSTAPVTLRGYTVATLPAGAIGMLAYVTDALAPAFLVAIVGGGAAKSVVFYDGTNWVAA